MSLHHIANHMAAQGRGPDDRLVHMSGKEVAGLQALANMHGGSLTRNPHTGLPEAGFLDSIMPALVGAAGAYFSVDPTITAGIMGLGTAAHTGNLGKGIMAGMGAYGGGNMMETASNNGLIDKFGTAPSVPTAPNVAVPSVSQNGFIGADLEQIPQSLSTNQPMTLEEANSLNSPMPKQITPQEFAATSPQITAQNIGGWKNIGMAAAPAIMGMMQPQNKLPPGTDQMIRPYTFQANPQVQGDMVGGRPMIGTKYTPGQDTSERQWFSPQYTALTPYRAAEGGIIGLAGGGPVEQMSNNNAIGANTQYPMADTHSNAFATPYQTPIGQNILSGASDTNVDPYTGEEKFAAGGGISSLGGYSDGGHLLKGPGDGVSDSIPAQIGDKQPARLADGEFVVSADVVSGLGNGSTDAGAKQLYSMMDRVRKARTGTKKMGKQINAQKLLPV